MALSFSDELAPLPLQFLSLAPVTPSFQFLAPPDEPLAPLYLRLSDTDLPGVVAVIVFLQGRRICRTSGCENCSRRYNR